MNELLQKLLEAEVLTDETKTELEEAFKAQLDEAIAAAKEDAAADVRAELTEEWVKERDALVDAIDNKVGDFLADEVAELKEDIEKFRDLEAEYAEKLVEAKAAMGDELKNDLVELVEKIDAFLEIRLAAEIEELREDIDEVRKNEFGRKIFEAFADEFMNNHQDEENAEATLAEIKARLADTESALEEAESKRADLERAVKLEEVLSPLSGRQKEVMEAILKTVETDSLEEGYKTFIGRVVRENTEEVDSEKEDKVLAEGADVDGDDNADGGDEEVIAEGDVKTGDTEDVITESEENPELNSQLDEIRKLAGIK
jgi:uncharacterized protein YukE